MKKPYEYELKAADCKKFISDLKAACEKLKLRYQCASVFTKPVSKGVRLNLFLLACPIAINNNGSCRDLPATSKSEWENDTAEFDKLIKSTLGKGVQFYVDEWGSERKFQAVFETYIKYAEL